MLSAVLADSRAAAKRVALAVARPYRRKPRDREPSSPLKLAPSERSVFKGTLVRGSSADRPRLGNLVDQIIPSIRTVLRDGGAVRAVVLVRAAA